jgi:hypothetical protein
MTNNFGHTTEAKRTTASIPRHLRNAAAIDIVAYMQEHWMTQTKQNDKQNKAIPVGKTAQMLFSCKEFFDPAHWKNPFYARFPQDADGRDATEWVKAAVIWWHGAHAYTTFIGVGSYGYAC